MYIFKALVNNAINKKSKYFKLYSKKNKIISTITLLKRKRKYVIAKSQYLFPFKKREKIFFY